MLVSKENKEPPQKLEVLGIKERTKNPFLSLQNSSNSEENPSLTPINLHILHSLWLPDVEILDLKAFETHSVLSKLEGRNMKYCHASLSRRPRALLYRFYGDYKIDIFEVIYTEIHKIHYSWMVRSKYGKFNIE